MRYLIDTDQLIDLYIGRSNARSLAESLCPQGIAVSIVSHGELFEGAFGFEDSVLRLTRIRALLGEFETLLLTEPVMEIFGRTRADLRRAGQLISDLDMPIAATALRHGLILLTWNRRQFTRIAGLHLYNAD